MICAGIFDTDTENQRRLREWISEYLLRTDREMDVLWFTEKISEEKVVKYAGQIQIAYISLEEEKNFQYGRRLYRENPSCRICYYRSGPCRLEPLLSTRPIRFYLWEQGKSVFWSGLEMMMDEISYAKDIFRYMSKRELLLIPFRDILYLQSDLKHVQICRSCGKSERIFAKLSGVEELLSDEFVRIHKSYIVNRMHVEALDRKTHMVRLDNGEILPVSDAQYEGAANRLQRD